MEITRSSLTQKDGRFCSPYRAVPYIIMEMKT